MSYSGNFVEYYDKIFSKKQYSQEVDYVFKAYNKHSKAPLESILDFGCGTGNHASYLSEKTNTNVVGYDCSSDMIKIAKQKSIENNLCFFTNTKEDLSDKSFDLMISMFYVVNHLTSFKQLKEFLQLASDKLNKNALLIFDTWNGIAAIKEPPYSSTRERYADDKNKIITKCIANTDLLNSFIKMKNYVEIFKDGELVNSFDYDLDHVLWTPFILKELLNEYNFDVVEINKSYDIEKQASFKDYKIMYVCKYRGNK